MALKDFDYKQFLLERGERVGLYAAGGLGFLLIFLSLVWPGKALFHASPKPAAAEMSKSAQEKNNLVQTASPSESEKKALREVPPELMKQASNVAEDPGNYRLIAEMFAPRDIQSSKRRNPNVLGPEEFMAVVYPAQVSNYMMREENGTLRVAVLTQRKTGSKPGKPGSDFGQDLDRLRGGGGKPGGGIPGMPGLGGGMGGSGTRGPSYGGPGSGGGPGSPFGAGGDEKKNQEIKWVTKQDLATMQPDYARDLMPIPMAIVSGAFPFKLQVEEFQKALRADNAYHVVVNEKVKEKNKQGKEVEMPGFRFLGFHVQRRAIGPDGKPLDNKWQPLDFESPSSPYRAIAAQVLKEWAPEDPKLQPLLYPGLVQPRPVQIPVKDKDKPGASKPYPEFEQELPKIKETLAKLNPQQKAPVTGNSKFDAGDFNPFGGQDAPATEGDATAPEAPKDWTPADYCVLRFLDVTVQPGQTYEYQIQVRMANPNLNKPDSEVAYHDLTTAKELTSDWCDVKGPDGKMLRVTVPTDVHYYAVDEQAVAKKEKKEYRGMNANKPHDATKQAVVQIHRWIDVYEQTRGSKTEFFPVGDWVVGERLFIYRGESLGTRAHTHVPIWTPEHSAFMLAGKPPAGTRDRRPTEDVPFIKEPSRAPLLVDFEGGTVSYLRRAVPAAKGEDGAPEEGAKATPATEIKATGTTSELLFLTADGKLVAHDSAHDENDEERKEREKKYAERVDEASGKPPAEPASKPMQ